MTDLNRERGFLKGLAQQSANRGLQVGLRTYEVTAQFGQPEATETKQLKTKKIEVFKYMRTGRSFALKITFENGKVVAWEDRR